VTGAVEKDLTLQFARLLGAELERRAGARIVYTRDGDRDLAQSDRAEIANRAHADVVLSLHFDGAPRTRAHGATAWCPPAEVPGSDPESNGLGLTPWRDVAGRHAVESHALAEAVTAAIEARGLGPARVRERMPVPLLGVNAPGLSLECATLTSPEDLARVGSAEGLRALAVAVAEGVVEFARHE